VIRNRFGMLVTAMAAVLLAGCSRPAALAADRAGTAEAQPAKGAKDEIILSAAEQATARIETEAARLSRKPGMLRANGRIALAISEHGE
jgi:hypothetical protein